MTINPVQSDSEYLAAAMAPKILAEVFALGRRTWKCRHCGIETSLLSEVCLGCGTEDVEQGSR